MLILPLFNSDALASQWTIPRVKVAMHTFPDGETRVTILSSVKGEDVYILASLNAPNEKILPLVLVADTLRTQGAASVHLIAPYLAYMRQDKAFHEGEGVSAVYFARLISRYFDTLTTIDPHLHRIHQLNEIYTIPTKVLHASTAIGQWIKDTVENPLIIGPDSESQQWVSEVAAMSGAPYVIADKHRLSDTKVSIQLTIHEDYRGCRPILVDDIIASGKTLLTSVELLKQQGWSRFICIGVHALFSEATAAQFKKAGATLITCDTIQQSTNKISLSQLIAHSFR